jgi:hypothetical protein
MNVTIQYRIFVLVSIQQARYQVAPARGVMPLPCDRHTVVRDLRVAFKNHIRVHVWMLRTFHVVALAGHAPPAIRHGFRGSSHFAAVVGGVTESNEIDHRSDKMI